MDAARAAAKLQAEQRSPDSIRIVAPLCPFVERTVPEGLGLPAGFVQVILFNASLLSSNERVS